MNCYFALPFSLKYYLDNNGKVIFLKGNCFKLEKIVIDKYKKYGFLRESGELFLPLNTWEGFWLIAINYFLL